MSQNLFNEQTLFILSRGAVVVGLEAAEDGLVFESQRFQPFGHRLSILDDLLLSDAHLRARFRLQARFRTSSKSLFHDLMGRYDDI